MRFPRATRHCKDDNRRRDFPCTAFTFLGYTFRPRGARRRDGQGLFTGFQPAVSADALKEMRSQIRGWRLHLRTGTSLDELAKQINPIVRGWMTYYGRFYRSAMYRLLARVNTYLMRWAARKYRRLRAYKRCKRWWAGVTERQPGLFAHWAWVRWPDGLR